MSYRVQTQLYSGPFDLLLKLVSKQKVDIGAISIAEVADQYIEELEGIEDMDLDVASDFVLVAATLLDMKAASLVPNHTQEKVQDDLDDEFSGLSADETREVLIARLIAYKQFRNAGAALGGRMEAEARMYPRCVGADPEFLGLMPDYLEGITLRSLSVICADLVSRRDSFLLEAEHIAPKKIPLALTIASVDRMTKNKTNTTFSEIVGDNATSEVVVVTFLALLELFKLGSIDVYQQDNFDEIKIQRRDDAPQFNLDEDGFMFEEEDV